MHGTETPETRPDIHSDPVLLARFFSGTRLAPVWIGVRLYVGWVWLSAGWFMLQRPEWMSDGTALSDAWLARQDAAGYGMTSQLISWGAADWLARTTAIGLTVAGIAVLLGLATGIASFLGILLSVNVIVTNTTQLGPEVFALAVLLVMAWKSSGWIGLDRWLLPLAGAPWPGGFEARAHAVLLDLPETPPELHRQHR